MPGTGVYALDPEFIVQHNALITEENRRAGAINLTVEEREKAQRQAGRVAKLTNKYPWLRPVVASVFTQVETPDEDVMRVFQNEWKTHGFQTDDQTLAAMEEYAASEDFAAAVKDQEPEPSMWERTTGVARSLTIGPAENIVKGIGAAVTGNFAEVPGHAIRGIPGVGASLDVQEATGEATGGLPNIPAVTPAVRGTMTALESPYQELQGATTRFILGTVGDPGSFLTGKFSEEDVLRGGERLGVEVKDPSLKAHSTGLITIGKLLEGEEVDLGSGYFPSGEIREEQARRARDLAVIDGRAATPGRLLASTVVEPGTKPYDTLSGVVDLGIILYGDPANLALGAVGEINRARRLVAPPAVGPGWSNWRKFFDGRDAGELLDSHMGRRLIDFSSGNDDYLRLAQATNWKLPSDLMVKLIDETDPVATRGILEDALGATVREMPNVDSVGALIRSGSSRYKITQMLPEQTIDLRRREHATQQVFRWMKNAKAPDEAIGPVLYDIASARAAPGQFEGLKAGAKVVEETLVARGVPRSVARQVTRIATQDLGIDARQSFVNEIADQTARGRTAVLDDTTYELPSSHLYVEHLNPEVTLPGIADMNKAIAKYAPIWGLDHTNAVRKAAFGSNAFLTHLQSRTWVPLQLLRGAWTVRVVGEEQLRMAASGLSSLFHHPISQIAWIASAKGGKAETMAGLDAQRVLSRGHAKFTGDTQERVIARGQRLLPPDDPDQARAWADEVITLNSDEIARMTAQAMGDNTLDNIKAGFASLEDNELSALRRDLAESSKYAEMLADGNTEGADFYIDTVATRVSNAAGKDNALLDTIATGKYADARVRPKGPEGQRGPVTPERGIIAGPHTVDKDFVRYLDGLDVEVRPDQVIGDITKTENVVSGVLDKATDFLFSVLMTKPTNWLSRAPSYQQFFWREVETMFPYLDETVRVELMAKAQRELEMFGRDWTGTGRRLTKAHDDAATSGVAGKLGRDQVEDIASGRALDSVKDLLYDLNRRSQFFEATRLLMPFGEAWKEVLTRWARIGVERPQTIRKFQVFLDGARESNPFELLPGAMEGPFGADGDPSRQGFFYIDAETGEEVFAYPWTAKLAESLPMIGVPIPMMGRAQGLNLALNLVPGFGLAVQVPASMFADKWMQDPKWDPVREFMFPYGEAETGPAGWVNLVAPAWAKKMFTSVAPWSKEARPGSEDSRLLNNTVMDVAAYLVSTGHYSMSSPEEMNRTFAAAEEKARWLYRLRGTLAFGAPSAPSPRMVLEDEKGNLIRLQVARDAYYRLFEKDPSTATRKFIDRFGEDIFYAVGPKTISEVFNAPVTDRAIEWVNDHPGVAENYPLTHGLFAPSGGKFDYTAYLRQLATGQRQPFSAQEWAERSNNVLGNIWYDKGRERLGLKPGESGTEQQRRWLADFESIIASEYPGYKQIALEPSKVPEAIIELKAAVNDQTLPASLRDPIDLYLTQRDRAIKKAEKGGSVDRFDQPAFATAGRNRPIRDWLRGQAAKIIEAYPEFAPVFERIFDREMDDDKAAT